MDVLNNNRVFIERRKNLRNNSTPQEIMIWSRIKNSALGFKFRRQHSFGTYILDFYCSSKRIGIEIDGVQHFDKEAQLYDRQRTEYLEAAGIHIIRFTNAEINTNIEGVLMNIRKMLESPPRF